MRSYSAHAFQSPSRRGWSCISGRPETHLQQILFQSPSRRGWSCIIGLYSTPLPHQWFQSPSRRGWSCIPPLTSVPLVTSGFSPLLEGDGLASFVQSVLARDLHGFSPLLEGDGLASLGKGGRHECHHHVSVPFSKGMVLHPSCSHAHPGPYWRFQSPSRRGWSCINSRTRATLTADSVSVPFSKGMVLHRSESQ